jgi:hypothetical protein
MVSGFGYLIDIPLTMGLVQIGLTPFVASFSALAPLSRLSMSFRCPLFSGGALKQAWWLSGLCRVAGFRDLGSIGVDCDACILDGIALGDGV